MYDQNQLNPSKQSGSVAHEGSQSVCDTTAYSGLKIALGIITKSHPIHTVQGFQRIRDFALQHQAGVILGKKSRVCGCGKRKIDKDLPRGVVYNEKTEKAHFNNVNIVGLFGSASHVLKKSLNNVNRKLP